MKAPRFILQGSLVFAAIMALVAVAAADPPSFTRKWGQPGQANGELSSPHGICVDAAGDVFVADLGNDRVQKLSNTGSFVGAFGGQGEIPGKFKNPRDVAVDAAGNIYVSDDRGIQVFDSGFEYLHEWPTANVAHHIVVSGQYLYAGSGSWVIKTDLQGNFVTSWQYASTVGASQGCLAVGPSGAVYVILTRAQLVRKYTADGAFVSEWGELGQGPGKFVGPQAIAVDLDEKIYVADSYSRMQQFSSTGGFLEVWGSFGSGDGEFHDVRDIATDAIGNIYVVDQDLNRVQVFQSGSTPTLETSWGALKKLYR